MAQVVVVDVEGSMAAKLLHKYPLKTAQYFIDLIPNYMSRQDTIFAEQTARGEAHHLSEELLVCRGLSAKVVAILYATEHEVLEEHGLFE